MSKSASKKVWVARILVNGECLVTKFYRDEEGLTAAEIGRRLNLWVQEEGLDDETLPIEIRVKEQKLTSVSVSIQEEFGGSE